MAWNRMPGCVGYCVNYRLQRRLKTLRLFCLGICAYQKYRQFHFLDYLRLMARLHCSANTHYATPITCES